MAVRLLNGDQEMKAMAVSQTAATASIASPWLTAEEAAAYLKYQTAAAVRLLVGRGDLVARRRRGRRLMFRIDDLGSRAAQEIPPAAELGLEREA